MATALDYLRAIGSFFSELTTRVFIRASLWAVTVFVSVFPAIHAAKVSLDYDIFDVAAKINAKGSFKDLFYLVIIVALIGILNIITDIIDRGRPGNFHICCYLGAGCLFIYYIFSGIDEFTNLSTAKGDAVKLPIAQFNADMRVIYVTCLLELSVEFLLAIRPRKDDKG